MSKSDRTEWSRRQALQAAGFGFLAAAGSAAGSVPLAPPDKQPPELKLPGPPMKKAGWAIVGLGQLALEEVMPAFAECERSRPVALVSGHPDKAKQVAAHYGIDAKNLYNYDNYDKLADNPDVDVVYIILPNSMHAEFTIRAHKAGKHVLCEKPMAATSTECRQMIDAAKEAKKQLMVAYRLRYEPFNMTAIEMMRKKALGGIKLIESVNAQNVKAPNIRLSKELAGGPLEDVGIYCLNATRYLTGEEPVEVSAAYHASADDPRFREVAESITWQLKFPSGVLAHCGCNFSVAESRRYRVHCTDGWLDLDPAFSYRGLEMKVMQGKEKKTLQLPEVNHFAAEMDHFSAVVLDGKECVTPGEEGLRDVHIIEKIHEAIRGGKTVPI